MKSKMSIFMAGFLLLVLPVVAQAMSFTFEGTANNGIGSATLDFDISADGKIWKVYIDNTSPTTLISGPGDNISAITGFGWDVDDGSASAFTWTLAAEDEHSTLQDISGSWNVGPGSTGSVVLDVFAQNNSGTAAALYNPAWAASPSTLGNTNPFFTTAILTVNYTEPEYLRVFTESDPQDGSPFVRMQRVGYDNDGSLKLFVPEPSSMLLVGIGFIGLAIIRRRKCFRKI